MIVLEVQDYCHDCPSFEADVQRPEKLLTNTNEVIVGNTVVRCEYRNRCERLKRYLERKVDHHGQSESQ